MFHRRQLLWLLSFSLITSGKILNKILNGNKFSREFKKCKTRNFHILWCSGLMVSDSKFGRIL